MTQLKRQWNVLEKTIWNPIRGITNVSRAVRDVLIQWDRNFTNPGSCVLADWSSFDQRIQSNLSELALRSWG
ncbi:hypothetical protein WICPIJ_000948 [Wickerhamomyces pijperi]|uniref:Uncharacterized protein n=1 Tax=Wickerhamomyces pijperi TaxID=599730 RepID=A0A9P8TR68_WICPI|nr:hypothetical protein WICPIJ_000948 [Wickerhamomyces pijperi]